MAAKILSQKILRIVVSERNNALSTLLEATSCGGSRAEYVFKNVIAGNKKGSKILKNKNYIIKVSY